MTDTAPAGGTWPPRLVVAGLGGDAGKTLVSLALVQAARARGLDVRAFKKGPDYIDAAWLAWASGAPARNLDTYLMGVDGVRVSFARHAAGAALALIEGNRGLYDGVDAGGTHSTAELAKALDAPVILVVNATKMTRTVAALVLGCQRLDPHVRLAGVVLNQVSGPRHERVIREAVETTCGVPIAGVLPRLRDAALLPGRHLGLVPPEEHGGLDGFQTRLAELIGAHLDVDRIVMLAAQAPATRIDVPGLLRPRESGNGLRIGYLRDSAFTFYYPENLEILASAGATLVPISSLTAPELPPDLHALYIGGGFPETHAAAISANRAFLDDLRRRAEAGMPVYAECGGLMLLSRAIRQAGRVSPMAGIFAWEVELARTPQGHGYVELVVDTPNPFFPVGERLRGHEFHYSRIVAEGEAVPPTACTVLRGSGSVAGRDGVVAHQVWASYMHVHAAATPQWAEGLLSSARRFVRAGAGCPPRETGSRDPAGNTPRTL
ncbi:MAG: cobyrinate a,c-diamide synthase [Acidobacteriota bacterium]